MIFREVEDRDLIAKARKGDVEGYNLLVSRWEKRVFNYLLRLVANREDALDVSQEAFLKAYQHLADFREACQFSTWLIRITVNQALMKLRKQRGAREMFLDEDFGNEGDILPKDLMDWAPNPEQMCWASELRDILFKALDELRPISRTVFILRDVEGLTIDQTAVVLNLSQTAVKARLWRVRLQLREALSKHFRQNRESAGTDFSSLQRHDTSSLTFSESAGVTTSATWSRGEQHAAKVSL